MAGTLESGGRQVNVGEGYTRTSDEAEADAHAAAGADAEGRAQLAEHIRPRHGEAPHKPPPPAARHLSPQSVPASPLRPPARPVRAACAVHPHPSKARGG